MDDYSRYIVYWELCETMKVEDVERTIEQAINKAGLTSKQLPRLLFDNGSCYNASKLKAYLQTKQITHIHGRPLHPQTQGKIERYHRSMKNVVKLDNYYYLEELAAALETFVHYYNHQRYHESLDNMTPADVYFGRKEQILKQRAKIKLQTLLKRRGLYQREKLVTI